MEAKQVTTQIDSKSIALQTGKLAKQADGAVVVACGETIALVTAVASPQVREGIDFFPLTVDIEERLYAVGRIPGAVFRREGRASEKGTLTARLTDRPIRPSFPDWFRHDTQIIATIMQFDMENPYDVHCITAASAALLIGGVPFAGPISGVRMGHIHGRWVPFPTHTELENAVLELVLAGRVNDSGDVDVMMVEAGGFEHTHKLIAEGAVKPTEEVLAEGLDAAKAYIKQLCELQNELVAQVEVPERTWIETRDYGDDVMARVKEVAETRLLDALQIAGKAERNTTLDSIKAELVGTLEEEFGLDRVKEVKEAFRGVQKKIIRDRIINEGKRIDGRGPKDIRALSAEVGLLPRAHGTGLFQRGETQALSVATLAMPRMEQFIGVDELLDKTKRYMHNYNMPPFSTGEAYPLRAPSRRAIGHGALAEKAVLAVLPSVDEFPYAIRVVSELLESNGSTSMASVCGSCLCLMDAGVPLTDMVGGIAMGLITEGDKVVTLTDIIGAEDGYGDMDFKVAGTEEYITALQLDTKTLGISVDVLRGAMQQAKEARLEILAAMRKAIDKPRAEMSQYAPRILLEQIPVDKIGEIIGPKGKTINDIIARTGAQIDVEDDGRVLVAGQDGESAEKALKMIRDIVNPVPLDVGMEFDGKVVKAMDFGAFINVVPGKDGLLHISKLAKMTGKRVEKVEDVLNVGDTVRVRISEIRPDGKLNLEPADVPASVGASSGGEGAGNSRNGDSDDE
jgi:polyribonucleotide nucleotidyltransferase